MKKIKFTGSRSDCIREELIKGQSSEQALRLASQIASNKLQFYSEEDAANNFFATRNLEGFYETGKEDTEGNFQAFDTERIDKVVNIANKQNEILNYKIPVFIDLTKHGQGRIKAGHAENIRAETRSQIDVTGADVTEEPKRTIMFDVVYNNKENYDKIQSGEYPSISPEFADPQGVIELDSFVFGQFAPHNRNTPIENIPVRKVSREREGKTEEVNIFSVKPILCFQGGTMRRKPGDPTQKPSEPGEPGTPPKPPGEPGEPGTPPEPGAKVEITTSTDPNNPGAPPTPPDAGTPPGAPPTPPDAGTPPGTPPAPPVDTPPIPADTKTVEQRMSNMEGQLQLLIDMVMEAVAMSGDAGFKKLIAAASAKKLEFGAEPLLTGASVPALELSAKAMKHSDIPDYCEDDARLAWKAARSGNEEEFLKFSTGLTKVVEKEPAAKPSGLNLKKPPKDFEYKGQKITFESLKLQFQSKDNSEEAIEEAATNSLNFLHNLPEKQKASTFKGIETPENFLSAGLAKIKRDLK